MTFRCKKLRVGILGFTFKENVPDIRNSKVVDIYRELQSYRPDSRWSTTQWRILTPLLKNIGTIVLN